MAPLDLFVLAEENDAALAAALDTVRHALSGDHAVRMGSFCRAVADRGRVSVNMKPWKMRQFLHRGRYATVYEIAAEKAAAAGHSTEDELRSMQGAHYERRVLFDRAFAYGERFLYGALNIGGAGADYYGLFCVILADEATGPKSTAFVPGNSLDLYVSPGATLTLDEPALRSAVATRAQRHTVAALKHRDDIAGLEAPSWAAMLCGGERFVEAIFVGDIKLDRIDELRLKQGEMVRLTDLAFEAMMGTLAATDQGELEDYNDCMTALDSHGLMPRVKEV